MNGADCPGMGITVLTVYATITISRFGRIRVLSIESTYQVVYAFNGQTRTMTVTGEFTSVFDVEASLHPSIKSKPHACIIIRRIFVG